jgi:L-aminoadipate-semialdehyde dehydrogenase
MVALSADHTENIKLWKSRLQNLTDLLVPTDYPRPLPARTVEEVQSFDLPEKTLMSLAQISVNASNHPTAFTVILAAFSTLLQRYTGDEEFAIGTSSTSGNPLVLRLNVDPLQTFNSVLDMVTKVIFFCFLFSGVVCVFWDKQTNGRVIIQKHELKY